MFKLESENHRMKISFTHYNDPAVCLPLGTDCHINIYRKSDDIWVDGEFGVANLNPDDQFNRSIGRKVSLARAVKKLIPDRDDRGIIWRRAIWEAYFDNTTDPRRGA